MSLIPDSSIPQNTSQIKRSSRSGSYLRWRAHVADAYRRSGMHKEADAFDSCSDPSHFFMLKPGDEPPAEAVSVIACSEHPEHLSKGICPSCQLRTCPDCAARDTARLLARYMPIMEKYFAGDSSIPGFRFRKIVLTTTIRLTDDNAADAIEQAWKDARTLFEDVLKSPNVGDYSISDVGLLLGTEWGPKGHKFHFHVLFYGPWIDKDLLSAHWKRLTGWHTRIAGIGQDQQYTDLQDAVAETVKYITKFWKRDRHGNIEYVNPDLVPIMHRLMSGSRRIRAWGLFYNAAEPEEHASCPTCKAPLIRLSVTEWDIWSQTGWLPAEAVEALRGESLLDLKHGNKSPPDEIPRQVGIWDVQ